MEGWLDSRVGGSVFENDEERRYVEKLLLAKIRQSTGASQSRVVPLWSTAWKIAASLLLLLATAYGIWQYAAKDTYAENIQVKTSTPHAIEKIMLADGTIVWLKPGSKLTYPEKFGDSTRVVSLQGEALFEVTKDPAHPFLIHCGDITTSVLGTSFNIKSNAEHTEVFVLTGKVSVSSTKTNENVELLPRESAVYAHATRQLQKINDRPEQRAAAYTQGTEYRMNFENITIGEIAAHIEAKFNVSMTLEGPVAGCLITADLTDQSLENTLELIRETVNATYSIQESTITLRGTGCL
jgi:ferric-dicitrate binding protein FerR (iron transport regulator)